MNETSPTRKNRKKKYTYTLQMMIHYSLLHEKASLNSPLADRRLTQSPEQEDAI